MVRQIDEQNDHLTTECQEAWEQLNTHASVGKNCRPPSYIAAVSANACVQSTDDQHTA